jgi:hypothetical protein
MYLAFIKEKLAERQAPQVLLKEAGHVGRQGGRV